MDRLKERDELLRVALRDGDNDSFLVFLDMLEEDDPDLKQEILESENVFETFDLLAKASDQVVYSIKTLPAGSAPGWGRVHGERFYSYFVVELGTSFGFLRTANNDHVVGTGNYTVMPEYNAPYVIAEEGYLYNCPILQHEAQDRILVPKAIGYTIDEDVVWIRVADTNEVVYVANVNAESPTVPVEEKLYTACSTFIMNSTRAARFFIGKMCRTVAKDVPD